MTLQKAMVSSKSNEWETPQDLFDLLNKEFHFVLDVAATKENTKCSLYYTKEKNGLIQKWYTANGAIWMNPPYGGQTGKWIEKAYQESLKGATVVCLIVSSTDRSYWHDYIFPFASQIRWIRGRIIFGKAKSTAPFASAIVIFDNNKSCPKFVWYKKSMREIIKEKRLANTQGSLF